MITVTRSMPSRIGSANVEEFQQKQHSFKEEFTKLFIEKLTSYHDIASGKRSATVTYTPMGNLVKSAIESTLSGAFALVPIIGPFAAGILTQVPEQIYEYYQKQGIATESEEQSKLLIQIGEETVYKTIEETAHEITRIFEYQIGMLKNPIEAKKLAQYSVEKIFTQSESDRSHQTIPLSQEGLIEALLKTERRSLVSRISETFSASPLLETQTGELWKSDEIFTLVGLRQELPGGGYDYKVLPSMGTPKYGYRGPIFDWNDATKTFIPSKLDEPFTESAVLDATNASYQPYQRLVLQSDLDSYLNRLHCIEPGTFKDFFKSINLIDPQLETLPVFRDITIKRDISYADFSHCDLSRIFLSGLRATFSRFYNSRMTSAEIANTDMTHANLTKADLRWAALHNVSLKGDTSVVQTNFDYALLGENTDFTDNISFGTALADNAHIFTDKIFFTLLERLQNQEQREARLEEMVRHLMNMQEAAASSLSSVQPEVVDFTGREDLLSRLQHYFNTNRDKLAVAVLMAHRGVGKTQTILEYVARNGSSYHNNIFWISAENLDSILEGFRNLAEKLSISTLEKSDQKICEEVQEELNRLGKVLLVFDDVEDPSLLENYLPGQDSLHDVFITTKNQVTWPGDYHVERLEPFTESEVFNYIQKKLPEEEEAQIKRLARVFRNLPLGLSQGIAFIQDNTLSIDSYLEYYERYKTGILTEEIAKDPYIGDIYTTFSMAVDDLASKYGKAVEAVKICAYLHSDSIPEALLDNLFSNIPEKIKSIALLKNSNLISIKLEESSRFIYIHKLLQEVIRIKTSQEAPELLMKACNLLKEQMPISNDNPSILATVPLLPHALAIIENYNKLTKHPLDPTLKINLDQAIAPLFLACGILYKTLTRYNEAIKMYQKGLSLLSTREEDRPYIERASQDIATVKALIGDNHATSSMRECCITS